MSGGFEPLPHAGHEISEAATHVESFDDVLSDAGSTPAASTNARLRSLGFGAVVRQVGFGPRPRRNRHDPAASTIRPEHAHAQENALRNLNTGRHGVSYRRSGH